MKSDVALTPLSSIQFIVRDNQSSCKVPVQKAAIAGRSVYQGQILQQFLPQYLHPSSLYLRHGHPTFNRESLWWVYKLYLSPTIGNQWELSNFSAELSNCLQAKVAYLQCRNFTVPIRFFGCQILQEKKGPLQCWKNCGTQFWPTSSFITSIAIVHAAGDYPHISLSKKTSDRPDILHSPTWMSRWKVGRKWLVHGL